MQHKRNLKKKEPNFTTLPLNIWDLVLEKQCMPKEREAMVFELSAFDNLAISLIVLQISLLILKFQNAKHMCIT